jgi:hypothetical protein
MARSFLVLWMILSLQARADFFGLGSSQGYDSKIPALVEKLKKLDMKNNPAYEDAFNLGVKNIEDGIEEEKLFCSGEAADEKGRLLPKQQKQLCFRELKGHYLEAMEAIFDLKKKYLGLIYNKQTEKLDEIHKKLKSDIDKSF